MNNNQIPIALNQLLQVIGDKEMQIYLLRQEIAALKAKIEAQDRVAVAE